jgi:hypothetical protein
MASNFKLNKMKRIDKSLSERVQRSLAFVESLELPPLPRRKRGGPMTTAQSVFDKTKDQSMLIGSDIVSFVAGTTPEMREIIMNCSLLAQLAANQRVSSRDDIRGWYELYFDTLTHLGWTAQERGFSEHHEAGSNFETNQAILSIAAVVLGPAATAYAVVESTLNAMKSMSDGPWMRIFDRESQSANAARFQVTVAEPPSNGGSMISLMAFELHAKTTLTQVLFFKFNSADVTLRHASGRVTIDTALLAPLQATIAQKVSAFTRSYVDALLL